MKLSSLFGVRCPDPPALPAFVRSAEDIGGVRVLRLQGPVGKDIGSEFEELHDELKQTEGAFSMPLLIDFAGTTGWDFTTVAFLVRAVRDRMASGARVGIIHASKTLLSEIGIAKLDDLFQVYTSEREAIADLPTPAHPRRPDAESPPKPG